MGTHPIFESDFDCLTEMAARFSISKFNVVGFDLDMTLCRYRTKPMMNLVYRVLGEYLVQHKMYPNQLLEPISAQEAKLLAKGTFIDWATFNIGRVDADGMLRLLLHSERQADQSHFTILSLHPIGKCLRSPTKNGNMRNITESRDSGGKALCTWRTYLNLASLF